MKYDVFISHAWEDKTSIVRDLANRLSKIGCKVWYDEFLLKVGDSLSRSIDRGLADSIFGVVVLSRHFLSKAWPEYELRGLTTREITGNSTILPILHGLEIREVSEYSPSLADKVALDTSRMTLDDICSSILKTIRPDIFENLAKTLLAERLYSQTKRDWFQIIKELNPRTDLPTELTTSQIVRLRMIRGLLHPYLSVIEPAQWLQVVAHQRDPELEILWFENLCVIWMEFARYKQIVTDTTKLHLLLRYLFAVLWKQPLTEDATEFEVWLTDQDRAILKEIMAGNAMID